jgi:hypothetical protein
MDDFMKHRALGVIEMETGWDGESILETETFFHTKCREVHKELDRIAYEEE